MARRSKVQIRETYSKMLGEDLVAKLSDEQIAILSKYYNSLNAKETGEVDSKLIQGRNDTVLHEMARDMVGEEDEEEDIPEGLDDLLGSIQDEPAEETPEPKVTTVKASAIVPSKFFGEDKYAKYRDELVADGTIEGEQLTTEERKEGFKTRNDSDKFSRFVENFLNRKKQSDNEETKTLDGSGGALVIPKQPKINVDPVEEESKSNFDDVLKGIDSILEVIKKDQKFEKKQANNEREKGEREGRSVRESKLEKKDTTLMKAAKKVLAPVKSIFDRIIEFFTSIFLGRALVKLLDWFGDEENGKKIDSIIKFLGDWWPALLGGFLIFGTGLGGFITTITGLLVKFTPKILALIAKNPLIFGAGAVALGGIGLGKLLEKDKVVENETARADTSRKALETAPSTKDESAGDREAMVQSTRLKDAGGGGTLNTMPNQLVDPLNLRQDPTGMGNMGAPMGGTGGMGGMSRRGYAGGGEVKKPKRFSGGGFNGDNSLSSDGGRVKGKPGIDKIPAYLTNGEFVMSAGAVQKHGVNTLERMNAAGGGTNKPTIMGGAVYANTGGHMDFDPVSYGEGMSTTKHIENPGNTGKSYVVGYDRSPEGNVVVKQINKVVEKKLFGVFGSDKLTGVTPGSEEWNTVMGSANTQQELSVLKEVPTSSDEGYSEIGEMKMTPPKSITTHPQAKTFHDYNQKFQTTKNKAISEGKDPREAEFEAAQEATKIPGINVATPEKREASAASAASEKNKPMTLIEMLSNAITGMSGVGSMLGGGGGKNESTREYSQANLQGAKLGDGYGSEGQKIAGNLGTFMKQKKSALPVTGSIHRHPKHLPWAKSGHSANSYHYEGRALDIGGWAPSHPSSSGNDEQAPVLKSLIEYNKKNKVEPVELIHGSPSYKNYGSYREHPDSHANHVHVAYNKGGAVIKKPAKLTVPEITPLEKQKPKVTMIDGGAKSSAPQRPSSGNKIPSFNASSASRAKANLLGIIDY